MTQNATATRCSNSLMPKPGALAVGALLVLLAGANVARAQLRIVTYNTLGNPTSSADFSAWNVVLEAIGDQSVNGIAQQIGIMALEEVDAPTSGANAQNIADLLNGLYGISSYHVATAPYGDGFNLQAFVYDSSQVELLDTQVFSMGPTRPGWRGHFRPVGYDGNPGAEFYMYAVHLKAFSGFEAQRATESAFLRSNGNNLGQGTNIIYAGDFNLTSGGSEQAYANMLASGNGQAIDVENGDFTDPLKLSYSSTAPESRLDFQFVTTEMEDDEGVDMIDGSYRVFGREYVTGTSRLVTSPTELTSASDHLPVVADYQVPAVMSAAAGSYPTTLSVGDEFDLELTVSNAADVVAAIGADELDYSITWPFGSPLLEVNGESYFAQTDTALGGGNTHLIGLDTSTPGMKSATITVASGSQGVQNPLIEIPINFEVVAAALLYGDYNQDDVVDAADYTLWRDLLGTQTSLPNEGPNASPGSVDADDYAVWKAHFGEMLAGGGAGTAGSAAVPEPASALLLLVGGCLVVARLVTLKAWTRRK
jgi:endonuclease/exonuclease/phosphatase family metal-dependent hydrolase